MGWSAVGAWGELEALCEDVQVHGSVDETELGRLSSGQESAHSHQMDCYEQSTTEQRKNYHKKIRAEEFS